MAKTGAPALAIHHGRTYISGAAIRSPEAHMTKVEIYTTLFCPYCHMAKGLLRDNGVEFTEIDVTMKPGKRQDMAVRAQGRRTVPQIFINDEGIGGCEELSVLIGEGRLGAMVGLAEE